MASFINVVRETSMTLNPIRRPKLREHVEEKIKKLILTDKLKVGDKLPSEKKLAEKMQVGRRSVREALQSLQNMGVIKVQHGKGSFFTGIDIESYLGSLATFMQLRVHLEEDALFELLEVRKILEAEVASLAAQKASEEDFRVMIRNIAVQRQAIQKKDIEDFSRADLDFHSRIIKGCKNNILETIYNSFSSLMLQSRRKTNELPGVAEENLKDHQDIFWAIKSRNAREAHHFMVTHINKTEQNMRKIFDK